MSPLKSVLLALISLLILSACQHELARRPEPYITRIFRGSYNQVWLAALKALSDYPLKISNKDIGRIYTEVLNGPYNELLFVYPEPIELPERFRYTIKLNFAKLARERSRGIVRIRIIKELERYRDFYTGWTKYPSDGLEERVVLYRIEHLLRIGKELARRGY